MKKLSLHKHTIRQLGQLDGINGGIPFTVSLQGICINTINICITGAPTCAPSGPGCNTVSCPPVTI